MLQIDQFRKTYNNHLVLQIDTFSISPGIYWVRGHNGSGKSTLLKAIAGITPFQGDIRLDQQVDSKKQPSAYRKRVNFAEAEPIFPQFLTGVELIELFKAAKKAPHQQETFYLETMQMTSYVNQPVRTYSSGMLKKLSLVLAFLGQPTCILLDEPLTTLDAESLPVLYTWIDQFCQNQQTIVLLSSHQVFDGEQLPAIREILVENATIRYNL